MTNSAVPAAIEFASAQSNRSASRPDLLRRFLNAYWLRPENAFWMSLRSLALSTCPLDPTSIDITCGDGIFSFLHCGGELADDFDVFRGAGHLDRVTSRSADMFDCRSDCYAPEVIRQPDRCFDHGCDLKPVLLEKAAALNFYPNLVQHDCNHPLPFADESFTTIYCNSAYWMTDVAGFLCQLRRITRRNGRVILHVKLADMHDYTLRRFRAQLGDKFLDLIDRGRRDCWPAVATRAEWETRFDRAGLSIQQTLPFVTRTHAQIWDVGLRPIAPLLVRMTNHLSPPTRLDIKRDWVALFRELLEPICHPDFDLFQADSEPAEIQYVLTPR